MRRALDKATEASVVVTPVAAPNPHDSTIVKMEFATAADVTQMMRCGAVGEIASHWWFNKAGQAVEIDQMRPIGLGIDGLRRIVKNRGRVVAVVAASKERIEPLRVALENKAGPFVNVLVTDHVTARELLRN